jgi:hypothetical protein
LSYKKSPPPPKRKPKQKKKPTKKQTKEEQQFAKERVLQFGNCIRFFCFFSSSVVVVSLQRSEVSEFEVGSFFFFKSD